MASYGVLCLFVVVCAFPIPAFAQDCPELLGSIHPPPGPPFGYTKDVAASGGYAYVLDGYHGLRVIDVSIPASPVEVGFLDAFLDPEGVTVSGSHAYIAAGSGLHVIDISDPTNPIEVGSSPGAGARDVAVSGGYAYVVGSGFRVFDVSTPSNPILVGYVPCPGSRGVAVWEGYAYIVDEGGLRAIDVSTPSNPIEVGFVDMTDALDVAVSGSYVYITKGMPGFTGSLRVIDVSTPSSPIEVGFIATPGVAHGVAKFRRHAYVTDGSLRVIDVSNPSSPTEVGFDNTPGYAEKPDVSQFNVFLADGSAGLRIYRDCSAIFIDGFESGDTSAWSRTVP